MEQWSPVLDKEFPRALSDLQRLCRQPSISAQNVGMTETVALVSELVRAAGGTVQVLDDCGGAPVIYAEFGPQSGPTLLFYNHYDVQPPEPLGEWTSPPFGAEVRDSLLYARGAADNKGDLMARLTAIRLLQENGGLPCRVKFLIEGEEEIGSPSLARVMAKHGALFAADACIWEFGEVDMDGRPQLFGGVKGMAYLQLRCRSANVDLHSSLGAVVENAAWRLVHALATLKDAGNRILIDGFYSQVRQPGEAERKLALAIPQHMSQTGRMVGLTRPLITQGLGQDPNLALCFEPTCTICGLESGYYGPGSKTVLPKEAQAKVDCRLVPDQDPNDILYKVRRHLDYHGFEDVEVSMVNGQKAYRTDAAHPFVKLVTDVAREAWGAEPVYHPSSAGTGPMDVLGNTLKLPIVSTGCSWYNCRVHAPDESIRLDDYRKGILMMIRLMERFGA